MSDDYKIKASLKSTKILILEDDNIMLTLIRDVLTVMGFGEICITKEGSEALKAMETNSFDLIFCDWRMRGMNGLEFTKAVRAMSDEAKRYTPIIMLTGYARQEEVEMARDAGVTEYVIKPFSIKSLCAKIKSIVEHPRDFVVSDVYTGPDRRRRNDSDSVPETGDRRQYEPKDDKNE